MRRYVKMVLFVADSHLGRSPGEQDRRVERQLIGCLERQADRLTALYIVGDFFEHYIEYRHLVPKGFVRLQGFLASLTDSGLPVFYLAGNHDPWHRDYFEQEMGIRVEPDAMRVSHFGRRIFIHHGDGLDNRSRRYRRLKPLLRHPLPVWVYRSLLPGDAGMSLARCYSRSFRTEVPLPESAEAFRGVARGILEDQESDLVVLAHTHIVDYQFWESGEYLNPGCWYADQTVGILDGEGARPAHWTGSKLEPLRD